MHIAFLNPQGNFDPEDSYWTEHPDFGGQLVYVKELAIALANQGARVDILTRLMTDPAWPEFSTQVDAYPGVEAVRILRIGCGPDEFLPKEALWSYLGPEWVPNILEFYNREGAAPDTLTTHYADGGLAGVLLSQAAGIPFTFTGHSLGAQKMDKMAVTPQNLPMVNKRYQFARRIFAERVSMNRAGRIITSTSQEREEQYGHPAYRGAVDPGVNKKFSVVPPGVNRRVFSHVSVPADRIVRERIETAKVRDIAEGRQELPVVVCSSRLDPKKNHVGLVRAFAQDRALQASANLAIVARGMDDPLREYGSLSPGEQEIMETIVSLLTAHDLGGKVMAFSLGSQAELAAAYRVLAESHSVFALTALYEPFGLAPLEAMSCGLPAVVTSNGGPSESLFEAGQEFGILVDPTNPKDIARGLLRVLATPQSWGQFHQAGMQRVLDRYTWDRTAAGYSRVLEQLLEAPLGPYEFDPPEYFLDPSEETDISVDDLAKVYFS